MHMNFPIILNTLVLQVKTELRFCKLIWPAAGPLSPEPWLKKVAALLFCVVVITTLLKAFVDILPRHEK